MEILSVNIVSTAAGKDDKMLLALSRGCCDASSRINGPAFSAAAGGVVTGGAYTFPKLFVNKDDTIR